MYTRALYIFLVISHRGTRLGMLFGFHSPSSQVKSVGLLLLKLFVIINKNITVETVNRHTVTPNCHSNDIISESVPGKDFHLLTFAIERDKERNIQAPIKS